MQFILNIFDRGRIPVFFSHHKKLRKVRQNMTSLDVSAGLLWIIGYKLYVRNCIMNHAEISNDFNDLVNKIDETYCTTATIHDYSCHTDCHNTTTYVHQ